MGRERGEGVGERCGRWEGRGERWKREVEGREGMWEVGGRGQGEKDREMRDRRSGRREQMEGSKRKENI